MERRWDQAFSSVLQIEFGNRFVHCGGPISDDEILRRCTVNCWPSEKVYWAVATPFKAIDRFRRRKNARGAVSVGGLEINFLALCEFSITYSMVVISKRVAISLLPPISQYPNPSSSGDNIAQDTS